jgi:GMP synthase-like glutamine amidotransferase
MRIHYLQHEPFEDPGSILEWTKERRHAVSATMMYENQLFPPVDAFDMLIIMGGGMSVYEEDKFPWLFSEKRFIEQAIRRDKAVLGICLGAQLIASALGAAVYKNTCKEIGWFPVTLTGEGASSRFCRNWPHTFQAFHWHGDTFDIPRGARWTAFSKATKNQSFEYGAQTIALQYHIESTPESVKRLVTSCADEILPGHLYIQPTSEILEYTDAYIPMKNKLFAMLDAMVDTVSC